VLLAFSGYQPRQKRRYWISFRVTAKERQPLEAAALRSGRLLSDDAQAALLAANPGRARAGLRQRPFFLPACQLNSA